MIVFILFHAIMNIGVNVMNNLYDMLNLSGNKENIIKESITKTRYDLRNIVEAQRCKIYSSYLSDLLREKHLPNKIIKTGSFSNYDHHFVLVPKSSDIYYLIDLTYSQFNNREYFEELLDQGYTEVNDSMLIIYLSIVTGQVINQSIDDIYFGNTKAR